MRESTIASAPQLMGLAISGVPTKPMIMLPVVKPTPTMKLAHTAAFDTRPQYSPHRNGPRNAPARAPQEIPMSCAMNVIDEWYCTRASAADTTMNTMMSTRMVESCFFSSIFFTTLPLSTSSVSVEDDVRTSDDSVDMEAESTSTITMPMSRSGNVESMVGMIESYTGCPFAPISTCPEYKRPKPPKK